MHKICNNSLDVLWYVVLQLVRFMVQQQNHGKARGLPLVPTVSLAKYSTDKSDWRERVTLHFATTRCESRSNTTHCVEWCRFRFTKLTNDAIQFATFQPFSTSAFG